MNISVYSLRLISPYLFHHSSVPIHFTISPFYRYSKISHQRDVKKAALDYQDIELFGSCSLNEGDSEEYVGKKNGEEEKEKEEE